MRDDRDRLLDILTAIDHIREKTAQGRTAFDGSDVLQVWVLHHLQIIGEAARCLSPAFKERHADKVWGKATGLRNILVHHYFEIDASEVWKVVETDLPRLGEKVSLILREVT